MQSVGTRSPAPSVRVPVPRPGAELFERTRFFLRQKHFSLAETYFVWGENETKLLFVERPAHHARNLLALLGGFVSFCVAAVLAAFLCGELLSALDLAEAWRGAAAIFTLLAGTSAAFVTVVALVAKRHVSFYRAEDRGEVLLRVEQDSKFQVVTATYTVKDPDGAVLARLSKNHLYDAFRKRWHCHAADGALLCTVKEDSVLRSLARRLFGPLLGFLRTNFVFLSGEREIGRFDRQLTLFDRYVLDVSADTQGVLDRRVALAIGVMLDTGERR